MGDLSRAKREKPLVRASAIVGLGVLADPAEIPKLAHLAAGNGAENAADNSDSVALDPQNEVLSIL